MGKPTNIWRVQSGSLDWTGQALSFEDALDQALSTNPEALGTLIKIVPPDGVPRYTETVRQLTKRGVMAN